MAEYHGKTGDVVFSGGYTTHLTGWSYNDTTDVVSASSTDDTQQHNLAGLGDCRGTWTCRASTTTAPFGKGATGIAILVGQTGTALTTRHINILVTDINETNPHDGIPELTVNWVSNAGSIMLYGTTTTTTTAA